MIQTCKYDSQRDMGKHRPCLSIDVNQVLETHQLPAGGGFDINFPDVSSVDMIGARVEDNFDAIEAGQNINSILDEFSTGTGNIITPTPAPTATSGGE